MEKKFIEIKKFNKSVLFSNLLENDYIFKTISREKDFYESELLDWLLVIYIDEGSFIDVGANIGNHTIFFSKIMERRCYSFEPNETAYKLLKENITINKLEKLVSHFKMGIGSANGKASITNILDNNLGSTTISYENNGDIEVKTLDSMIPKSETISLIKIDVEGFELDVLAGAKEVIQKNSPILLIECMDRMIINKTVEYMKQFQYEPITLFGATPMVVFVHKLKIINTFGENVPNFYSELKSYISEQEKIRNINKRYRELSESKDIIKADLDEARKKYRFSTEQIAEYKIKLLELQNNLKEIENSSKAFKEEKDYLEKESEKLQKELEEEKSSNKDNQKRLEEYREEILKKERELIRLENEYQKSIEQLDQANEKYRNSTDEIETLEKSINRFKEEKDYLEKESEKLQKELEEEKSSNKDNQKRLEEYREEILKKERELIRLENEYQKSIEQLDQANEKYRNSTDEIETLEKSINRFKEEKDYLEKESEKLQKELEEEKSSNKDNQKRLEEYREEILKKERELIRLENEYQKSIEQLDQANEKYRNSTDEIETLEKSINRFKEEKDYLEKESEKLQKELEEEKSSNKDNQKRLEEYREEILKKERELIRLENEYQKSIEQLDQANEKYRNSTDEIETLEKSINRFKEEKDYLEKESEKLQKELEEEKSSNKDNQKRLEEYREEILKKERELIRLENEYQKSIEQLDQANEKYRNSTDEIETLEKSINRFKEEKDYLEKESEKLQKELEEEKSSNKDNQKRLEEYREEILKKERELIRLENEYQKSIEQLDQANEKYRNSSSKVNELKLSIENLRKEKNEIDNKLSDANLKYRHQVNEVVPYLKKEIDRLKFQIKQKESDSKYKAEQLNQKVLKAEQKAVQIRSTLTFQIGYQVVHAFNPWYNIFSLPMKIWKIKKEFKKRKELKTNTISNMSLPKKADEYISLDISTKEVIYKKFSSNLSNLRMACIMDEFTYTSYQPECILMQLTPQNWKSELEEFNPEVLFVESAWRGKDDLWGNKVGHNALELQNILAYCKQNSIPTLFWNKEDPVHFETFLNTAQQFDYVFTTDMDCIHRYKGALGHERVYLLPFATQPKMHNPIEKYDRKDAFCFAGAYYVRYPDRTKDLGNFVIHLSEKKPFEIYDRNFGKEDPNYMFPDEYKPFIVGTLPHSEIDKAYKGYNYAINLNSIKQSQTMFARRVFELLSSNTITISNFSRGVRLLFGDLVFTSDNAQELLSRLDKITSDDLILRKHRLLALRKVLKDHTYAQRLSYIVSKIQNTKVGTNLPAIGILAYARNKEAFFQIIKSFEKQTFKDKKLYVVIPNKLQFLIKEYTNIVFVLEKNDKSKLLNEIVNEKWIAFFSEHDYYGENYILDLILSTQYFDGKAIGKSSYFSATSSKVILEKDGYQYKTVKVLNARSSIVKSEFLINEKIVSIGNSIDNKIFNFEDMLSIDEFNYCLNGVKNKELDASIVDDIKNIDQGIDLDVLLNRAESIEPLKELEDKAPFLDAKILDNLFKTPKNKSVELSLDGTVLAVKSHLEDGKHEYIYAREDLTLKELGYKENMKFYMDTTLGLNIQLVVVFLDAQKQKISHVIKTVNRNQESDIPLGTQYIRFGLRIYAGGYADIKALVLGHRPTAPAEILGKAQHLVLTNNYPSYDDLYKNGFVHSRVKAYKQNNINVDIFKLRVGEELRYEEFEDIDIISGDQLALDTILKNRKYQSILVHFLSPQMWEILQKHIDNIKVVVWVHGAEIHPWYRRKYNLVTKEDEINAKKQSEERMAFWHSVLDNMHKNLHLVFVSNSFSKEVFEDIGYELLREQYSIIHNPIDTQKFKYIKKDVHQRKKILSIRPFASRQYANDLSVKAILELSKKPFFDELEFHIVGDGKLFDETIEPIKEFKNVTIERKFITQTEIAQLHKEYGLFLCPTRWDSQGVSRDEAMASGLIPITNAVAAIPEFIDSQSGILAPQEDYKKLTEGIEKLYYDEKLFLQMSESAHQHVMSRDKDKVVIEELDVFRGILND